MALAEPDLDFDVFRDDFVGYLAQRFGVPHEEALATLGDWLLSYELQSVDVHGLERKPPK